VWTWEVPAYFFTGGTAGAAALLAAGAELRGRSELARAARRVAAGGALASAPLLVSDLGRPERFLNMLRVFKVTSPMSVGSWVLAASGGAATTAAACERLGVFPRLGRAAAIAAATAGAPLSVYTATLLSDTAVPVWHEARRELPFLFATGAGASAGAAATMLLPPRHAKAARRIAVVGALAGEGIMAAMDRRLGFVGEPYRQGAAATLKKASTAASFAGAAVLALRGRRSRTAAVTGGALVLGGELAMRWSVFKAGFASAADPAYTVRPQRERLRDQANAAARGD